MKANDNERWDVGPDGEDPWDQTQFEVREGLLAADDPLLREALYRQGEACIARTAPASAALRDLRLRHLQLTYLLTCRTDDMALC